MKPDELYESLNTAVVTGDEKAAPQAALALVDEGEAPTAVIAAMSKTMAGLGEKFSAMEIFVPDLLVSADAFEAAAEALKPALAESSAAAQKKGTVVIGVVEGDIHTLGKNLVRVMLAADGFEVRDLGRDVKTELFIETAEEIGADIIALSALMTTTMGRIEDVIADLKRRDLRQKYRVIIGGAPITEQFARKVGADGYAEDAPRAVALANSLVAGTPEVES